MALAFDRGVTTRETTLNDEHEQLFEDVLLHLHPLWRVVASPKIDLPGVMKGILSGCSPTQSN